MSDAAGQYLGAHHGGSQLTTPTVAPRIDITRSGQSETVIRAAGDFDNALLHFFKILDPQRLDGIGQGFPRGDGSDAQLTVSVIAKCKHSVFGVEGDAVVRSKGNVDERRSFVVG